MITPKQAYEAAVAKGFYEEEPTIAQRLVLIIGELSEAVEAIRNNNWFTRGGERTKTYLVFRVESDISKYKNFVKGTVEEEIADTYIRILDFMGWRGYERSQDKVQIEKIPTSNDDMEFILGMMKVTTNIIDEEYSLNLLLCLLETFAKKYGFDLNWHVEQKFKYNQTRPYKHNKQF